MRRRRGAQARPTLGLADAAVSGGTWAWSGSQALRRGSSFAEATEDTVGDPAPHPGQREQARGLHQSDDAILLFSRTDRGGRHPPSIRRKRMRKMEEKDFFPRDGDGRSRFFVTNAGVAWSRRWGSQTAAGSCAFCVRQNGTERSHCGDRDDRRYLKVLTGRGPRRRPGGRRWWRRFRRRTSACWRRVCPR